MMKGLAIVLGLSLVLSVCAHGVAEVAPYVGEVTAGSVNVRAGAGTNHPILKVAKQGERLVVRGEEFGWLRVDLPEGVSTWVSAKYVETADGRTGKVTATKLNIRRRPAAAPPSLGELTKGAEVTILEKSGDWYRIQPPRQAGAYISAKYVKYFGGLEGYQPEPAGPGVVRAETPSEKYAQARSMMSQELKKPLPQRDFSRTIALLKEVSDTAGSGTPLKTAAESALQHATLAQTLTDDYKKTAAGHEELKARMAKLEEEVLKSMKREDEEARFLAEGWVEPMGRVMKRPATHKLVKGEEVLYMLNSSKYDLNDYLYKLVGVKGNVVSAPGWESQIIDVTELKVLAR